MGSFIWSWFKKAPKEYFKIEFDLSKGSAYRYKENSKVNTSINFRRIWNGKIESDSIKGLFTYRESLNIVYFLKRGYSKEEIYKLH